MQDNDTSWSQPGGMAPSEPARPAPGREGAPTAVPAGALDALHFDERGLIPVVVQDAGQGDVLMLAYANREALARTLAEGRAWFYSRSRQCLWRKGETSGNELAVRQVRVDCDGDAVLYLVAPSGPACHTGERSCFHRDVAGRKVAPGVTGDVPLAPAAAPPRTPGGQGGQDVQGASSAAGTRNAREDSLAFLASLETLVRDRQRERPDGSYTASLFAQGLPRILQKVGEEAVETVVAGGHQESRRLVEEAADLVYHLTVLLVARDVSWNDVIAELRRRGRTA